MSGWVKISNANAVQFSDREGHVGTNVHEGEDKERSTLMGGKGTFVLRRGGMHMLWTLFTSVECFSCENVGQNPFLHSVI